MQQIRNAQLHGIHQSPPFHLVLVRYCEESTSKKTSGTIIGHAETLINWVGEVPIDEINDNSFNPMREHLRKVKNLTPNSVNRVLEVARATLRKAHLHWRNDSNKPLLLYPTHIQMYPKNICKQEAKRRPYPLSPNQEIELFNQFSIRSKDQLPPLKFIRHTGLRDQECCGLKWNMEQFIPEIGRSIFFIDGKEHKNGYDRVIILNDIAWNIIENQRGLHDEWVFPALTQKGVPRKGSNGNGRRYQLTTNQFQEAWVQANLPTTGFRVGVHNLRHTFGARLLQVGCPERYIRIFLGHAHASVTDVYTEGEVISMIEFANKAAAVQQGVITRQFYKALADYE